MSRFSAGVAPRTSVTWSSQLLPKIVTTGVSAATSSRRFGSSPARVRAVAGRAERGELGRLPAHRPGGREELDVLGVGARPAALDVGHAVLVEHPRDAQLVGERQRDVLALRAVAQGRVVEDDRAVAMRRRSRRHARRAERIDRRRSRTRSSRRPRGRRSRRGRRRGRRSASPRRAPRRPRPRRRCRDVLAPERQPEAASRPTGSCRSGWPCPGRRCPARSRGSARTGRTSRAPSGARRARPTAASRGCRRAPAASSDRMSPNRFSVTMTSKSAGPRTRSIAHESTSWWFERRRRGSSRGDLVDDRPPQARRRQDVGLVDARHPAAAPAARARRRAGRCADLALRRTAACRARARSPAVAGRLAPLPEVDAAGQLADDQQVDAVEQLRAERRRGDERRMDGDRPQVRVQARARRAARTAPAPGGPAPTGRTTSGRRPRRAGSRRPSPQALDVLGPDRDAVRVDRGAAGEDLGPVDREAERASPAASTTRRAAATTSGPTPSPGIVAIR